MGAQQLDVHPLQHLWCIWTSRWKGQTTLTCLAQFDTIQGFWLSYHSNPTSQLPDKQHLHIFKNGIKPMWEDPMNIHGGHFKLTAKTTESAASLWQTLTLSMIGELLPTNRHVTGASVVAHNVGNHIVKLWLGTVDKEVVNRTKAFLQRALNEQDYVSEKITFVPHKLVIKGSSSQKMPQREPLDSQTSTEAPGATSPDSPSSRNQQRHSNASVCSSVGVTTPKSSSSHSQKRNSNESVASSLGYSSMDRSSMDSGPPTPVHRRPNFAGRRREYPILHADCSDDGRCAGTLSVSRSGSQACADGLPQPGEYNKWYSLPAQGAVHDPYCSLAAYPEYRCNVSRRSISQTAPLLQSQQFPSGLHEATAATSEHISHHVAPSVPRRPSVQIPHTYQHEPYVWATLDTTTNFVS